MTFQTIHRIDQLEIDGRAFCGEAAVRYAVDGDGRVYGIAVERLEITLVWDEEGDEVAWDKADEDAVCRAIEADAWVRQRIQEDHEA